MAVRRTLILMRHAKSSYPGGVRDHDRPLSERGVRDAMVAGAWLRAGFPAIDDVLCSTATRTLRTAEAIGVPAPLRSAPEIYEAAPEAILEQIRLTGAPVRTLLVVGHAPGLPGLAMELADAASDRPAEQQMHAHFPTAAIAVLQTDVGWSELDLGDARLTSFHIPRG